MSTPPQAVTTARQAYEEDVRRKPFYHDGTPRRSWDALSEFARMTWEKDPAPRDWATPSMETGGHHD